ncbi:MAG: hypothetical protein CMO13_02185 [Thaumarchaeota archaeon]|nr:hypothetical protein [Nitrososphaerota archaeon]|tara:strand:- start:355 stop:1173 length:819 start_codon:yes stop_codon:yes gene_type:complete
MFEIFTHDYIVKALVSVIIISLTAPLLGMFVVSRRMSLIGDTLSHLAFAGIAIGIFLKFLPTLTAVTISIIASLILLKLIQSGNVNTDAALAVFFSSSMALAIVLLSLSESAVNINEILFGSILLVSTRDLIFLVLIGIATFAATAFSYKKWLLTTIDREISQVNNINVNFYDNVLIVLTSILIVISVPMIGVLLISSLLVLPILIGLQITNSFKNTIFISIIVSLICSVSGIYLAYYLSPHPLIVPPGGVIVLILSAIFSIIVLKNYFTKQ